MRAKVLVAMVAGLLAAACAGAAEPEAAPTPRPTIAFAPTPTPEPPDMLAFDDSELELVGDTGVLVTPGELVVVDHLLRNTAGKAQSVAIDVVTEHDLEVTLSARTIRAARGSVELMQSTVQIPADAPVGAVLAYDLVAMNSRDSSQGGVTSVTLLVTDAQGERPVAGADRASTQTNERAFMYVVEDDTDADGDLQLDSIRVVAGGWLADQITGAGDGTITYVPFANVEGTDVFLYEVCDAEDRCGTALVEVEIG